MRIAVAAAVALAVVAGVVAVGLLRGSEDDDEVDATAPPAVTPGSWEALDGPPIEPRVHTTAVWTGEELLVIGGDAFLCPPDADCIGPEDPPFSDGAALDPETGEWRRIADAPVPVPPLTTSAVVDGDAYLLVAAYDDTARASTYDLLRYRRDLDRWDEVAAPPLQPSTGYGLVAAGDRLVAHVQTEEGGGTGDAVLDPETDRWEPLPPDPLSPASDRTMVWLEPHLYLFDKELVANPGSEAPSVARAARLDLARGEWERLPDSEILTSGPWVVEGERLINPTVGGADGGDVNPYGREYPYGGIFDGATRTWSALPPGPPDATSVGAVAPAGAVVHDILAFWTHGPDRVVLDTATMTWVALPGLVGPDEPDRSEERLVWGAGRHLVAVGGQRWSDGGVGVVLDDALLLDLDAP